MTTALRRWAAAVLALVLGALPWALDRLATPPQATRLHGASFGATVDDDAARAVALPHRWAHDADGCSGCRTAWYRFDLPLAVPPRDAQALLLPRAAHNAAVYLNGRLLAQGGRFADPAARLGPRPLWAEVPPALWNEGDNRLYVLVKADRPRAAAMSAPALASAQALRPALAWRQGLAVTLPQVAATAAALLAIMMGVLWHYRRQEAGYGSLALAAGGCAAAAFARLTNEPPWPDAVWDGLLAALAAVVAGAVARLVWRLAQPQRRRRALAWGTAVGLAAGMAAVAAALEHTGRAAEVVDAAALAVLGAGGLALVAAGWRRAEAALAVPGGVLALAALHDGLAPWRAPMAAADALPALPLALALLLGVAAWTLLLRFVQALNVVELLNIDLEGLVAERTAALQAQFERVRELERQQTVAAERERLMRDMHDGVGGHLVAMLAMIEADRRRPGELAVVVRDALDDMRLMIDSLEPVGDDLNAVLAMFRDRLAPRMLGAGVELHWDVELLPPVPGLTPTRVLHVLRILQEAVTNAIRHGRARTIRIGAAADVAGGTRIEVRDDGAGFDPQAVPDGRGLKNMARRAREVGATLDVRSTPGAGASVVVRLGTPTT